jgi:hypothetical protein
MLTFSSLRSNPRKPAASEKKKNKKKQKKKNLQSLAATRAGMAARERSFDSPIGGKLITIRMVDELAEAAD